jgi:hypothetical protein
VWYSWRYTPFQLSLRYKEGPAPVGWSLIPTFQVQGFGGLLVLALLRLIFHLLARCVVIRFLLPACINLIWYHYWYHLCDIRYVLW